MINWRFIYRFSNFGIFALNKLIIYVKFNQRTSARVPYRVHALVSDDEGQRCHLLRVHAREHRVGRHQRVGVVGLRVVGPETDRTGFDPNVLPT